MAFIVRKLGKHLHRYKGITHLQTRLPADQLNTLFKMVRVVVCTMENPVDQIVYEPSTDHLV